MRKYAIYVLGAAVGLAVGIPVSCAVRSALRKPNPQPSPSSSAVVLDYVPSAASSSSTEPPVLVPTAVPSVDLEPLLELPADATYGSPAGCLHLRTRVAVQSWNLPYPYHVTLTEPGGDVLLDCGFFGAVQASGWRTAFCLNGDKREPKKLYLYVGAEAGTVDVTVMEKDYGSFSKGDCK